VRRTRWYIGRLEGPHVGLCAGCDALLALDAGWQPITTLDGVRATACDLCAERSNPDLYRELRERRAGRFEDAA